MPKTKISEYSTTNADNTDIEGINIAEGCAPSGINNAIREIMVHLKEFQTGASGDGFTFAGGTLMTGTNTLSGTNVLSGSTTAAFAAGSASAPSIYASGDTNTGIFFPAADTIAFAEGGAEAMRIDSSGNVGIGTTSPVNMLHLSNTAATTHDLAFSRNTVYGTSTGIGGVSWYSQDGTTRLSRIASDTDGASTSTRLTFVTSSSGTETERMRIDSSGNVLVGTPTKQVGTAPTFWMNSTTAANGGIGFIPDYEGAGEHAVTSYSSSGSVFKNLNIESSTIKFWTGATTSTSERMRITSAGEVLVGGTTVLPEPYSGAGAPNFSIQGTNNGAYLALFRNDTSVSSPNPIGDISFYGNDTTSNTPTRLAYVAAVASGTHAAGDNPTDLVFGCTNDGSETVAEFARIGQAGAVTREFVLKQPTLTDSTSVQMYAYGGTAGTLNRYSGVFVYKHSGITNSCGAIFMDPEDGTDNYLWVDNSDVLRISTTASNIGTTGGTVVGTQTSDERIKNIIGPVTYGLEQIKSINPVEFTLKDDAEQTKRIGFIAQQVQPIVPESVYDTKEVIVEGEPTKLGMEYVALIPVLVNAVKELSAKCDALQAEVNQLKGN